MSFNKDPQILIIFANLLLKKSAAVGACEIKAKPLFSRE